MDSSINRTGFNNLNLQIYVGLSTTLRPDWARDLPNAKIQRFSSFFPGGRYGELEFFIPRPITRPFLWRGGDRVVAYNGLKLVWEGVLLEVDYSIGDGADQGLSIAAVGSWGRTLGSRLLNKRWADIRITDAAWIVETAATGAELATVDRNERIRITTKAEAWANGDTFAVEYSMPTGETIKRITLSYDMQEAAQAWELRLRDRATPATLFSVTASGTGTQDITLGTPVQTVYLEFISRAAQTPTADGAYYGEISAVNVYSETGAIDLEAIAADIITAVSDLNSSTDLIETPATSLELDGFSTRSGDGAEFAASVLSRAAKYGDGDNNAWYAAVVSSEEVETPDGLPVLKVAQYPALTDYDYTIAVEAGNLRAPIRLVQSYDIFNYVIVEYRDPLGNRNVIITPDDDSTLKDQTSIDDYGQRDHIVNAGTTSAAAAADYGRRILASNKAPIYNASSPISVVGYISDKNNAPIPACEIQPGKRIRITNFFTDLSGVAAAGLTFIITRVQYDDGGETCNISTGKPDDLDIFLAQRELAARS